MACILIIEDEVRLAEAYAFLLQTRRHVTHRAADGLEGLSKAAQVLPDLILLDLMMPKLDGLGFLRQYEPKKHPEVKIVLLSNMQSQECKDEALDLGACCYELKSALAPPQLMELVDKTLAD